MRMQSCSTCLARSGDVLRGAFETCSAATGVGPCRVVREVTSHRRKLGRCRAVRRGLARRGPRGRRRGYRFPCMPRPLTPNPRHQRPTTGRFCPLERFSLPRKMVPNRWLNGSEPFNEPSDMRSVIRLMSSETSDPPLLAGRTNAQMVAHVTNGWLRVTDD